MPHVYATLAQFYALGLRAEAFVAQPRAPQAVNAGMGIFTLPGHGASLDDPLRFVVQGAPVLGASGGSLPGGLVTTAVYYAIPVGSDMLQVAASPGGAALTYSDAGAAQFGIVFDPTPKILLALEEESREVDDDLVANETPIKPYSSGDFAGSYPLILTGIVCRGAARKLVRMLGLANPLYKDAIATLFEERTRDDARRALWRKGEPLSALPEDQTPGIADDGAASLGGESARTFYGESLDGRSTL